MGLTYGFYNSVDGDRRYDADQFSSFLDGIVYDGVYGAYGNCFNVINDETEDLGITVDTGRAWFNHTWTLNDTYYKLTMPESDLLLDRIDAVVIEVNKEDRVNYIKVVQGTPAESPVRPTLKGRSGEVTEEIYQYALAYIARPAGSAVVTQDQIVYVVDTSETPLCSALALAGIPSGGKIGQVLAKKSSESAAVGWYDVDRLPRGAQWYIVNGITEDNVVAAYKFKGAESLNSSLRNVNDGTEYTLSVNNNVTFTPGKGLLFPASTNCYINNEKLIAQASNIMTCVFRYSDLSVAAVATTAGACTFSNRKALFARYCTSRRASESIYEWTYHALLRNVSPNPALRTAKAYESGCLAADWNNNSMWHDGIPETLIVGDYYNISGWYLGRVFTTCSFTHNSVTASSMYLAAIVFYNTSLTTDQHICLAEQMNEL